MSKYRIIENFDGKNVTFSIEKKSGFFWVADLTQHWYPNEFGGGSWYPYLLSYEDAERYVNAELERERKLQAQPPSYCKVRSVHG